MKGSCFMSGFTIGALITAAVITQRNLEFYVVALGVVAGLTWLAQWVNKQEGG